MEMTAFNFIIYFFRRGVVHILKRGLFCYIKMGAGEREQARNPKDNTRSHLPFSTQVPKTNPVMEHALSFRRRI